MKSKFYVLYIFCIFLIVSCAVEDQCNKNRVVTMNLGFYHVSKTDTTYKITSGTIDSITVKALKFDTLANTFKALDSILYNKSKKLSKIDLPLHKFETISIFEIKFNNTKDTLIISHQNIDNYLSLECGCIKNHSIDTALITKHFADSIKIINHKVNNVNAENIKIYK